MTSNRINLETGRWWRFWLRTGRPFARPMRLRWPMAVFLKGHPASDPNTTRTTTGPTSATLMATVLSAPVLAQTDTTTTILQGLQNWNSGNTATAPKTPTTLDSLKSTALAKASLAAIDTDRNGTVSKTELAAVTNRLFDVADSNRDGQLSEEELSAFAANMNKVLAFVR